MRAPPDAPSSWGACVWGDCCVLWYSQGMLARGKTDISQARLKQWRELSMSGNNDACVTACPWLCQCLVPDRHSPNAAYSAEWWGSGACKSTYRLFLTSLPSNLKLDCFHLGRTFSHQVKNSKLAWAVKKVLHEDSRQYHCSSKQAVRVPLISSICLQSMEEDGFPQAAQA